MTGTLDGGSFELELDFQTFDHDERIQTVQLRVIAEETVIAMARADACNSGTTARAPLTLTPSD